MCFAPFFKKTLIRAFFVLILSTFFINLLAFSRDKKICLILDKGGKDDKSFNQSAYEGFIKAQKDFKLSKESKYVTLKEDSQSHQFIRAFSSGDCGLIIAVGFSNSENVGLLAKKYPQQKYVLVDSSVQEANVLSFSFHDHEGSFLIGAIAAMKSKSKRIGFIGGMEIPLIKRFAMGYIAGAKYVDPKIQITETFVGMTSGAWNNPTKAKELALSLFKQGHDIIFVAAGGSSQGVFDAVQAVSKDGAQKFVIGIDSNQNYIAPGLVLTSMEKKVSTKVYEAIKNYVEDQFVAGVHQCSFADGSIDWSYDKYNKSLFKDFDIDKINKIKKALIEHKITVPDYYKEGK
jgi:basic membrane protein A